MSSPKMIKTGATPPWEGVPVMVRVPVRVAEAATEPVGDADSVAVPVSTGVTDALPVCDSVRATVRVLLRL